MTKLMIPVMEEMMESQYMNCRLGYKVSIVRWRITFRGLLLCWHLYSSRQELQANRITGVEDKYLS